MLIIFDYEGVNGTYLLLFFIMSVSINLLSKSFIYPEDTDLCLYNEHSISEFISLIMVVFLGLGLVSFTEGNLNDFICYMIVYSVYIHLKSIISGLLTFFCNKKLIVQRVVGYFKILFGGY